MWSTEALALLLLAWSLAPFSRRRVGTAAAVAAATLVLTVVGVHEVSAVGWVQPSLPLGTEPWVWAALFALAWTVAGSRGTTGSHRVASIAAGPATLVMCLALFNGYFLGFPTLATLFGHPAAHEATPAQVVQIASVARRRVAVDPAAIPLGRGASLHGVTLPVAFPATTSHFAARPGWLYLPPAWFGPARSQLPVVVLISGSPASPSEWLSGGYVDRYSDAFASAHHGFAPILAMVDVNGSLTGDTECVDRTGSLSETYALVDVRRDLISRFGVTTDPRRWAVAGLSAGGTCALDMALRHPSSFGAFGDFGGEATPSVGSPATTLRVLFHGSSVARAAYDPKLLLARHTYPGFHAMFVVGTSDPGRGAILTQAREAARAGMRVDTRLVQGGHTFWVWRTAFRDFLPFAWQALGSPGTRPAAAASAARAPLSLRCLVRRSAGCRR